MSILMRERTSIFPKNNEKITIFQGKAGDCYMLAALDCLFNSNTGLERVRSMFNEYSHGIELKINRNKFSENMLFRKKTGVFKGKYYHIYDPKTDTDLFLIPNHRLNYIDSHREGVQSNSLAVKIFEHVLSYYYDIAVPGEQDQNSSDEENPDTLGFDSFDEHNRKNRLNDLSIESEIESEFFASIFNIEQFCVRKDKLGSIIIFKQDYFNIPIYVALDRAEKEKHAYRIQSIKVNTEIQGGFEFILLDPWNNVEAQSFTLEQIRAGNPFFVIFNWTPELRAVICNILCIPNVSNPLMNPQQGVVILRNYNPLFKLLQVLNRRFCMQIRTDTIEAVNFNMISKHFLIQMLAICNITTPVQLMECIFDIDAINKELATILFQLAKDNIPSLFLPKTSYFDVSCVIFRATYYDFKNWFDAMDLPATEVPGAQDIFVFRESLVYELNNLEVSYVHCACEIAIEKHKGNLLTALEKIITKYTIRPGFANALEYQEILDAYNAKKGLIETEAKNYVPHMQRKNTMIHSLANLPRNEKHTFFGRTNTTMNEQVHLQIDPLKMNA